MATLFPQMPVVWGLQGVPIDAPNNDPNYNNYNMTTSKQQDNAKFILWYLVNAGWTYAAAVGVIANMRAESDICPTTREKNYNYNGTGNKWLTGCGLIQWTPYSRVSEFLSTWGGVWENLLSNFRAQMRQVQYELDATESGASYVWHYPNYYPTGYGMSKNDFKITDDYKRAAGCYVIMRERPATMGANGSLDAATKTVNTRVRYAETVNGWLEKYLNDDGTLNYSYGDFPYWIFSTERGRKHWTILDNTRRRQNM